MNASVPSNIVLLTSADGARAEIHRHGAHLTSWQPAGGGEQLFLSTRSAFAPGAAIRGGVPVIFPQFAALGPLPKHGFARTAEWVLACTGRSGDGAASAAFHLVESPATRDLWPHAFLAELRIVMRGRELEIGLQITNRGAETFPFTAALHTYLHVTDIAQTQVQGLQGIHYRDSAAGGAESVEQDAGLRIAGEVDRIYLDAPDALTVIEAARTIEVRKHGFADTVVWNPGAQKAAALADLEPGGWRSFLCVEAAVIGRPVELRAGESWSGTQTLVAV